MLIQPTKKPKFLTLWNSSTFFCFDVIFLLIFVFTRIISRYETKLCTFAQLEEFIQSKAVVFDFKVLLF